MFLIGDGLVHLGFSCRGSDGTDFGVHARLRLGQSMVFGKLCFVVLTLVYLELRLRGSLLELRLPYEVTWNFGHVSSLLPFLDILRELHLFLRHVDHLTVSLLLFAHILLNDAEDTLLELLIIEEVVGIRKLHLLLNAL